MNHGYELSLNTPTDRFAPSLEEMNPEVACHRAEVQAVHDELAHPPRRVSYILLGIVFVAGVAIGQGWALA